MDGVVLTRGWRAFDDDDNTAAVIDGDVVDDNDNWRVVDRVDTTDDDRCCVDDFDMF